MKLPLRYVIFEGPDLAGKSSLIKEVHKSCGYVYNLIDRSYLSRVCYARQFKRNVEIEREGLQKELSNLNNQIVILFPSKAEILRRYKDRGDEIQDEKSLESLWKIYEDEINKIKNFPNVFVLDCDSVEDWNLRSLVIQVVGHLYMRENSKIGSVGKSVSDWVNSLESPESVVDLSFEISSKHKEPGALTLNPKETEYYKETEKETKRIIQDELDGKNPYGLKQTIDSRRFYYSSDTCISSIHFLPRGKNLKVMCVLRSTDVDRNAVCDLTFLSYLSSEINRYFKWSCNKIEVNVRFNSAHVRTDLKEKK